MRYFDYSKSLRLSVLMIGAMVGSNSAVSDTISQVPMMLVESVPPNLILTLDDSGSMIYAFSPDDISERRASRRAKSAIFNTMYYNPAVTYRIPPKIMADGAVSTGTYAVSFTSAPNNGFHPDLAASGVVDLSQDYKAAWSYRPGTDRGTDYGVSSSDSRLAENPAIDFGGAITTSVVKSMAVGASEVIIPSGSTSPAYKLTRTGDMTCAIEFETANVSAAASCVVTGSGASKTYKGTLTAAVSPGDLTKKSVSAYYYVYDESLMGCPLITDKLNDDRCYRLVNVTATSGLMREDDRASGVDERMNFAIWYSFYRNRILATSTAASLAFDTLPPSVRLTWQSLNQCNAFNSTSSKCSKNFLRRFTGYHRGNFFNWLANVPVGSGTPLPTAMKRAGNYLHTSSDPWAYDPNPLSATGTSSPTVTAPQYACRSSYHILMTDGEWNQAEALAGAGDESTALSLPDGKTYSGQHPYFDTTTNTLADFAFYYWATDANPSLPNTIKTNPDAPYWDPRNDPATWQHLVTFTIGLGLGRGLKADGLPWEGSTFAGPGYAALVSGAKAWPPAAATAPNNANNVYDLWHAAINSRGQFFSAESPDTIVDAFAQILSRIGGSEASASKPILTPGEGEYEAGYDGKDWSGDLVRSVSGAWSAKSLLDAKSPGARVIKMYSATGDSHLSNFTWSNLSAEQKAMLNRDPDDGGAPDADGENRLNYLRGVRTGEGTTAGTFRSRSTVLGDIVNSSPLKVGPPGYWSSFADAIEGIEETAVASYKNFKAAHATRDTIIYVGANDGMLHAFDATSGEEIFAYVPSAVFENLYRLTGQSYNANGHRYYVDGTPVSADVYFESDGAWHTVLVGTLGGGGRSIFALDITDPTNIKLLWEKTFTPDDPILADLGYSFPIPQIARLYSGQWAVVTGNGYNGASTGKAALMIFDVASGNVLKELVVTGDATKPNGLSSVKLSDYNNDGVAEYAYAGDLQGNLWRFDLFPASVHSSTAVNPFKRGNGGIADSTAYVSDFAVSYGGKPMFTAKDSHAVGASAPQPITAPPSLVRHPTSLGYLVIFGTGKYFEVGDSTGDISRAMSLYGIWDRETKGQLTSAPSSALTRSDLVSQQLTTTSSSTRTLTQNAVPWYAEGDTEEVNKWGWVLDFAVASSYDSEMVIKPLKVRGSTLLVDTFFPSADPCNAGTEAFVYGIDPATGGKPFYTVFDMSGDGNFTDDDNVGGYGVAGYKLDSKGKAGGTATVTMKGEHYLGLPGSLRKYSVGPDFFGRQTWSVGPEETH